MDNYFHFPFAGDHPVTSPYGWRTINGVQDFHPGTDFGWNPDEGPSFPVLASAEGDVVYYADEGVGGGRTMTLAHEGGEQSRYYHLDHNVVSVGDHVALGQWIAMSGNTGGVAPHLHFEIHDRNGQTIDPMTVLQTVEAQGPPEPVPTPAPIPVLEDDNMAFPISIIRNSETAQVYATNGMTKRYLASQDAITLLVDSGLAKPAADPANPERAEILDRPAVYVGMIPDETA